MPKVTIWIREGEDHAKWKAIENKPEWLHEHLDEYPQAAITYKGETFVGPRNIAAIERILESEPTKYMEAVKHIKKGDDGKPIFVFNPEYIQEGKTVRITLPFQPKPVKQIIDETNQAVVESLGNSEVLAVRAAQKAKEREEKVIVPISVLCEHFQPKGQCMVKGCKYGKGAK